MMFLRYAIYRFITMLLTLWVVSIMIFVIINLLVDILYAVIDPRVRLQAATI